VIALQLSERGLTPPSQVFFRLALSMLLAMLGTASAAAQQLPDGAGKETTVKVCGTCHPAERGASVRLTREGWQDVIVRMVGIGAKGTDAELTAVLDYLATHFKGAASAPLNLNRATPQELQAIAGLLRKESALWIAHRAKAPCASVDDLKAVAGIDFARIEKRRDRLVCF
jgi:DNA uptake protein ComE-like DNA-binding protein